MGVHDADTITVLVDLGYHISVEAKLRLVGIDAPELTTVEGKLARDYLKNRLNIGLKIVIKTYKDKTEKYGRWLAEVYVGDVLINQELIDKGFAVYYDGGKRLP